MKALRKGGKMPQSVRSELSNPSKPTGHTMGGKGFRLPRWRRHGGPSAGSDAVAGADRTAPIVEVAPEAPDVPTVSVHSGATDSVHSGATDETDHDAGGDTQTGETGTIETIGPQRAPRREFVAATLTIVLSLCALGGWLGWRAVQSHDEGQRRATFLEAARQEAINLTTIDYRTVDGDIKRILDSATGRFRDDFQNRSGPFVDAVRQAQSVTEGTVLDAGIESVSASGAVALVAVSVKSMNNAAPQQQARSWRMRISVERPGGDAKVSNVEFVV